MNQSEATSQDPELLLDQTAWIRRLAARLVDPSEVDDVVQTTLLSALRRPPPDARSGPKLRAWLSRATGNVVRMRTRSAGRRQRIEQEYARRQQESFDDDDRERDAVSRRLTQALRRIREPYRQSLMLRFYEDLPPRQLARRLGISRTAARKRVSRGLALLREDLEQEYAKEGQHWATALVPLLVKSGMPRGSWLWPRLLPWTALLVGLTAIAIWWGTQQRSTRLVAILRPAFVHAGTRDVALSFDLDVESFALTFGGQEEALFEPKHVVASQRWSVVDRVVESGESATAVSEVAGLNAETRISGIAYRGGQAVEFEDAAEWQGQVVAGIPSRNPAGDAESDAGLVGLLEDSAAPGDQWAVGATAIAALLVPGRPLEFPPPVDSRALFLGLHPWPTGAWLGSAPDGGGMMRYERAELKDESSRAWLELEFELRGNSELGPIELEAFRHIPDPMREALSVRAYVVATELHGRMLFEWDLERQRFVTFTGSGKCTLDVDVRTHFDDDPHAPGVNRRAVYSGSFSLSGETSRNSLVTNPDERH